ncbi:hypothetical protein [Streptomyces odonnellii]|uniref:hypothetical protein n=1 Tax=Streptomyces odonnellii TaxID=1417980 RepID=UPI0012FEB73F|nr:hypothetical protein [Streptomyces odonnellii]
MTDPGHIAPYPIAQTAGVTTDRHGVTALTRVNGVAPRIAGRLNAAFPFNRDVYNVVPTARLTGGATPDADLIDAFVGNSTACAQPAIIERYGFATIANRGSTVSKASVDDPGRARTAGFAPALLAALPERPNTPSTRTSLHFTMHSV